MPENTTQPATTDTGQQVLPVAPETTPDSGGNPPDDDDGNDDDGQLDEQARRQINTERRHRRAAERKTTELNKTVEGLQAKVKQYEDRDKTDEQKRVEELEASKAETQAARDDAAAARLELLRWQVGTEKGVEAELISLLVGNTREEIEAVADRLASYSKGPSDGKPPPPRKPAPDPRLGHGKPGTVSTTDQFAAAMKQIL